MRGLLHLDDSGWMVEREWKSEGRGGEGSGGGDEDDDERG